MDSALAKTWKSWFKDKLNKNSKFVKRIRGKKQQRTKSQQIKKI